MAHYPLIPFLAIRGAQIFFAIIVLGLSADVGSELNKDEKYGYDEDLWSTWFSLVTALLTLIGSGFLIFAALVAAFESFTAPLITLGLDAFLFLFWLISLAGFANRFQLALDNSCFGDLCGAVKGNMAMIVFEFLLFIASLVWSVWWFFRSRSSKTAPANPEAGSVGAIGGAPVAQGYPMQQPTPVPQQHYAQQPYPPAAPVQEYKPA